MLALRWVTRVSALQPFKRRHQHYTPTVATATPPHLDPPAAEDSMSDRDYAIRYQVERGLWTKAELAPHGGADALLICSILRQPSGGVSYQWLTPNGDAAIPIPAHELFSAWLILGE